MIASVLYPHCVVRGSKSCSSAHYRASYAPCTVICNDVRRLENIQPVFRVLHAINNTNVEKKGIIIGEAADATKRTGCTRYAAVTGLLSALSDFVTGEMEPSISLTSDVA